MGGRVVVGNSILTVRGLNSFLIELAGAIVSVNIVMLIKRITHEGGFHRRNKCWNFQKYQFLVGWEYHDEHG